MVDRSVDPAKCWGGVIFRCGGLDTFQSGHGGPTAGRAEVAVSQYPAFSLRAAVQVIDSDVMLYRVVFAKTDQPNFWDKPVGVIAVDCSVRVDSGYGTTGTTAIAPVLIWDPGAGSLNPSELLAWLGL